MNMLSVHWKSAKGICHGSSRKLLLNMQVGSLASVFIWFSVLLVTFCWFQNFAEGLQVCFDGSKEGYRFNSTVIKYTRAETGEECVVKCMREHESCRSINFRKNVTNANCEFLKDVDSEVHADHLLKDQNVHYYILLEPKRERPQAVTPTSSTNEELSSSCEELLEKNMSLGDGVYKLRNNDSLKKYQVYCHMSEIPECGNGSWTLVMKVDGNQSEFNYSSPYWTNKETYAVKDGLEGLTEKQTKLASYWNTPFNKICLGMKVNGDTKWTVIGHEAGSLFDVIADGAFKKTFAGKEAWKSLINGSSLQENCNKEGFNIQVKNYPYNYDAEMNVRLGFVANNQNDCNSCDSCIGFGILSSGCGAKLNDTKKRITSCGNVAICNEFDNKNTPAFGYILVQLEYNKTST